MKINRIQNLKNKSKQDKPAKKPRRIAPSSGSMKIEQIPFFIPKNKINKKYQDFFQKKKK